MNSVSEIIKRIKTAPEPEGWPGDIKTPFRLGRAFVSPKTWQQYAEIVEISLNNKNLTSIQESVDKQQVIDLIKNDTFDVFPLPLVTKFPNGILLIEDGNHRLAAKKFLGHNTAKVRLITISKLPKEVIKQAISNRKLSMKDIKNIIETVVKEEINKILIEQTKQEEIDVNSDPLYHVTYYNRLPNIAQSGLRVGMDRSIGGPSLDTHSTQGTFLSEDDGISFWYSRAEEFAEHKSDNFFEEGLIPVVLRINSGGFDEDDLIEDKPGSDDSLSGAYIYPKTIKPNFIDVWDGNSWISVLNYDQIDIEQAIEIDEEGDEQYIYFNSSTPLLP